MPPVKLAMDNLLQDVRYGIRTLARQPGFAATAILTLALGIGATTAIFSVVNAVVLRPLPFTEPDRMVVVTNLSLKTGNRNTTVSGPDFTDWREQSRSFAALSYYQSGEQSVTVNNASDYATTTLVAPGYFRVLGATARMGRLMTDDEERPGGPLSVVISDGYWRRQFASDSRVIGSTIINGQRAFTIVGVTEARYPANTDIYYADSGNPAAASRSAHNYRVLARLAPGVSVAQAQSEMTGIAARLSDQYPLSNAEKGAVVVPLQEIVVGDTRQTLFVLLAAVAFVLLIACANVANLLLARASARGRELVVRGRDFNDGDRLEAPFVAIINEQLARDAFPGVDPIGRTIRGGLDTLEPMTIVGVVKDVRTRGPGRPVQAELYMPYEQHQGPATLLNIVIRTDAADPLALGATAARQIRSRHPEVPVRTETMAMTMSGATAAPRFRTVLLVVFAVVALLLAIAGVYGVMAYTVNQRAPEIGLRVALGAAPSDVIQLVLREGALLVVLGLTAGAALSFAGARFISGLLFGVSARDPLVFAAVSSLVAVAAISACLVPGRRALKVDPLLALRAE